MSLRFTRCVKVLVRMRSLRAGKPPSPPSTIFQDTRKPLRLWFRGDVDHHRAH